MCETISRQHGKETYTMTPSGTQSSFFPKFDELDKIKIVTFCQSEV